MFCETCGKEMADNSLFCPGCGAKVGEVRTQQSPKTSIEIADKAKAASQDAVQALRVLATNPTGGLSPSFEAFDRPRALGVGIVFALIFDLCLVFSVYRLTSSLQQSLGGLAEIPFLGFYAGSMMPSSPSFFKLFIFGLVPFVSITAAIAVARSIFRGTGALEGDVFTAGASLLPLGLFFLASGLLGFGNAEAIAMLGLFALCYTILMIYAGCTRIAKMSESGAAFAVPIIILLSAWLSKIIFTSLLSSGMGG